MSSARLSAGGRGEFDLPVARSACSASEPNTPIAVITHTGTYVERAPTPQPACAPPGPRCGPAAIRLRSGAGGGPNRAAAVASPEDRRLLLGPPVEVDLDGGDEPLHQILEVE